MRVEVESRLPRGVTAKDIALAVIGRIGTAGGTGSAIEFAGSAIGALSMEGRMQGLLELKNKPMAELQKPAVTPPSPAPTPAPPPAAAPPPVKSEPAPVVSPPVAPATGPMHTVAKYSGIQL